MLANGTFKALQISNKRAPLTRFAPLSYFYTCWNETPSFSPKAAWLKPSALRPFFMSHNYC
jgi:hypothetical protein